MGYDMRPSARLKELLRGSRRFNELAHLAEEPAARAAVRAKFMRPWRVHRFLHFGEGSIIDRPAYLYGAHHIWVGDNALILRDCWIAAERPTWHLPGPVIELGDRFAMRPNCTLSASESIRIEHDVVFGTQVTVVDSNHTWREGHDNVLDNSNATAPIVIGAGSWLGDRVSVLMGSRIGRRCAIGANSVVNGEIPDGCVAVGAPARVIGRTADL